jgi:hypothetical protein
MSSPAPSSPAPPKPPKPPPLPQPRVSSSPSLATSVNLTCEPNRIVLEDNTDECAVPQPAAACQPLSDVKVRSLNASNSRTAPRISTASAIAATRDIQKRWCGAHDAAANGDLMRLKAYIDASDGSPKRNVNILHIDVLKHSRI